MVCSLVLIYFGNPRFVFNKCNLYVTLDYWSGDMSNFNFLEKGLEIVSSLNFGYDLSRKMSLILCSISWPNFINWLSLLREIFGNMCIEIVCFPGCDVINFEINLIMEVILSFESGHFCTWWKSKDRQKFKYLDNKFQLFLNGFQWAKIVSNLRVHLYVFGDEPEFKHRTEKLKTKKERYRNTKIQNTERQKPSFSKRIGRKCKFINPYWIK